MAARAERFGTKLLKKFACGLAKKAGSTLMEKGLEEVLGDEMEGLENDVQEVKKEIQEAIKEIHEVKEAVDRLANKLSQSILQLRSDNLKEHLTKINSLWNEVIDILETAVIDADIADAKTRKGRMRGLQTRLEYMLAKASNEIPGCLEQIHGFLGETGENSFLRQLAQQAFDSSRDFRLFFVRARSLVESYWSVVSRGVQLLQMATEAPKVDFYNGRKTTERHLGYIEQQHELFVSSIGKATVDLFDHMFGKEQILATNEVSFTTNTGAGIEKDPDEHLGYHLARLTGQPLKWNLISMPGREVVQGQVKFDWFSDWSYYFNIPLTDDYLVNLQAPKVGGIQVRLPYPFIGAETGQHDVETWYIKPYAPGSDRFIISQADECCPNLVIAGQRLWLDLTAAGQSSPSQDKLFQVRPWIENV